MTRDQLAKVLKDNRRFLFYSLSTYASDDWLSGKYTRGIESVDDAIDYLRTKNTDFTLVNHAYNGGHPVADHKHGFFEMMYVYSGSITHHLGDRAITLHRGDCLLLAPWVEHSIGSFEPDDIAFNIIIYPDFLTSDFLGLISSNSLISDFLLNRSEADTSKYLHFACNEDDGVIDTAEKLLCEFLDPDVSSANMSKCLLAMLFNVLLRVWKAGGKSVRHRSDLRSRDILQILQYIETNLADASLSDAAIRFGYEMNYFSKVIKKTFGKSFIQVKHGVCIDYAKILLKDTELSVAEIADQIGFSNMSHFYKLFKEHSDTTPAEYRQKFNPNS